MLLVNSIFRNKEIEVGCLVNLIHKYFSLREPLIFMGKR